MQQNTNPENAVRPMDELLKMRIIDMTGAELLALGSSLSAGRQNGAAALPPVVYGIDGLARLLDVSISTACRIKKSGVIDDAITQIERTIIIHTDKALSLLHEASLREARKKAGL